MKKSVRAPWVGVFFVVLFGTACQKDFQRIEDWVDYQATQIPESTPDDPVHRGVTKAVIADMMRSSVAVQNFQLTRIDDKPSNGDDYGPEYEGYSQGTQLAGKRLREAITRLLAQISAEGQSTLAQKINCGDALTLHACVSEKITSLLARTDRGQMMGLIESYLGKLRAALPRMDTLSEHFLFQHLHQTLAAYAETMSSSPRDEKSIGSGWFMVHNDELYVVTNNHVVERDFENLTRERYANRFKYSIVYLLPETDERGNYKKATTTATLVSRDPLFFDVALLKVDDQSIKSQVKIMPIGDDRTVRTGDFVIAAGTPRAMSNAVSFGHVNYSNRYMSGIHHYLIQHTALINPGNSGGPLFNHKGEILGINTYGYSNYGFAIPISSFTNYLKNRLLTKNREYYVAERGFIKVPEEGYNVVLDLHLGKNRGAGYSRLKGMNVLMVSETRPLEFNKDYRLSPNPVPGTIFTRYRVDGAERTIDSSTQLEFDIAFSKTGKVDIFVATPERPDQGEWVPVPTRKYTYADYRVGDKVVEATYAESRGAYISAFRSMLNEGIKKETIRYFTLDGAVNGKLVEYDFNRDGMKELLYVSNDEILVFEKFNNLAASTIEEFRTILTQHMNNNNSEGSEIPPVTFQFRNVTSSVPAYAKAMLGARMQEMGGTDVMEKRVVFDQAVKLISESVVIDVFKLYRENIKKILAMKPMEIQRAVRERIEFPEPEKNQDRFFQMALPWALGGALSNAQFLANGKAIDGTSHRFSELQKVWQNMLTAFKLNDQARTCFISEGTGNSGGWGDFDDQYRYCTSGPSLRRAANGELEVNPDATIALFRNSLVGQGKAITAEIQARYDLKKDKTFELFNLVGEFRVADYVAAVKNIDLAQEDDLAVEGLEHLIDKEPKKDAPLFSTAEVKRGGGIKTPAPQTPERLYGKVPVGSNPYFYQDAIKRRGYPYLYSSDLKSVASNNDTLTGYIFDLRTDETGSYPKETNFHLFVLAKEKDPVKIKDVYTPEDWRKEKIEEMQARNAKHAHRYKWNPEMRATVIELDLRKLAVEFASRLGLRVANEKFPMRVTDLVLTIFYKKNPEVNSIAFYPIISAKAEAEGFNLKGPKKQYYETSNLMSVFRTSTSNLTAREQRENAVKRWGHRTLWTYSSSVTPNKEE